MINKFFTILVFAVLMLFVGVAMAKDASNQSPQPIMQSSPLINPNATTTKPLKPPSGNACQTGNCPPMSNINPNAKPMPPIRLNQNPNQNGVRQPTMPGGQMPPPGVDQGPPNLLIILDASYSMVDQIGRDRKIDIAKRVVHNTVKQIPPNTRVGLRVYGHKIGLMGIYPCRKTELLVPIDFNTGDRIISKLRNINPTGQTPITYSIKTAVMNDFNGLNGPKRIILVSDGMETCDGNPCEYAVEMVRRGIDLKVDVVGFALKDPAAINQLKCVALSTGGKFYTADTEAALARSLQNSFAVKTNVQGKIIFK